MKRLLAIWLLSATGVLAQTLQITGQVQQYTVATLPAAASNNGQVLWVTNANATTVGTTVAAGGTNFVPTKSNGTNWLIISAGAAGTAGAAPQSFAFTAQTSVAMTHNLGTLNVVVACYDNQASSQQIFPANLIRTSTNVTTVTFQAAQTGSCVVNGGVGPTGATGAAGSGAASYVLALTSSTSYTVAGSTHNLATDNIDVICNDAAIPANRFLPGLVTVNASTYDVVISMLTPKSGGKCILR